MSTTLPTKAQYTGVITDTQRKAAEEQMIDFLAQFLPNDGSGKSLTELDNEKLSLSGGTLNGALHQAAPVTIASVSGVITLTETSDSYNVTGTEAVTSLAGWSAGRVLIQWASARTLTNSANLSITTGADRAVNAGDISEFEFTASGVCREIRYLPSAVTTGNPTGTLIPVLSKTPPTGYLKPNGAAISRSIYANLMNNSFCSISTTGNITSGSAIITNLPTTVDMAVGMHLEGTGIPAGATISSINSLTSITISANATVTATSEAIVIFPFGNGDGSTTYNLPDFRGEHLRIFDDGRNVDTTALSGVVTSGSTTITGLSYTGFMFVGMPISGSGIPTGATVASITSSTGITISASATASSTATLTFNGRRFGSFESDDYKNHIHGVQMGTGSQNYAYASYSTNNYGYTANTSSSGGAETRGRNYAVPVYIKY